MPKLAGMLKTGKLSSVFAKGQGYFNSLDERDKKAFNFLGVVVFFLIAYFGIWSPINNYVSAAMDERDRQLELIQWMRSTEKDARSSGQEGNKSLSGQSLLTQISRTAKIYNITPSRLQPEGNNGVSVWFDSVAFNDLIKWLQKLHNEGNMAVKQISIDAQPEPGKVSARMVFST